MITFFEKESKLSWFIVIVIAVMIFWLSSLTFGPGAGGTNFLSVLYHFFAFFFLSAFLLIALVKGREKYLIFILAIFIAIVYGISDEFHQYFVPGRSSSVGDVFVDTAGIMMASLIYFVRLKVGNFINSKKSIKL